LAEDAEARSKAAGANPSGVDEPEIGFSAFLLGEKPSSILKSEKG